jgi:hypothetical protein
VTEDGVPEDVEYIMPVVGECEGVDQRIVFDD